MRIQNKHPWAVKDTKTKAKTRNTKMNTQNVTKTPANPTQTTNQSMKTIISQVSWTNNMILILGETCRIRNENVTSHQRFTYTLQ